MFKLIAIGNLTRDPDLRALQSGTFVCNFSIAINRKYKDKADTTFIDCVVFGKRAETISQYLFKGSRFYRSARTTAA